MSSRTDLMPNHEIVVSKKLRRMAANVCLECGYRPCCCAVPKSVRLLNPLPIGMRKYKRRPKEVRIVV
jgi:hypothetical protein